MKFNMGNIKKVECHGYTRDEAIKQAPFTIIRDATQAWKNAEMPMGDSELKLFMEEYLQKHTKMAGGIGCSITLKPGVADSRQRPYKIEDVKNEKGKRKFVTIIEIKDDDTKAVLLKIEGTKTDAKNAVKELYIKQGYKGNITASYTRVVKEGEPLAFKAKYTPSINATKGVYICFGVE